MTTACVIVCLIALTYNVIDLIDAHIDKNHRLNPRKGIGGEHYIVIHSPHCRRGCLQAPIRPF